MAQRDETLESSATTAAHPAWATPAHVLALAGALAAVAAALASPADAGQAAAQDWPPFVLVAGLLLIGFVAAEDGLFAAAGHQLARLTRSGAILFLGATLLIGAVTAVLNLDTAVAFLTPVLVYAARSRGGGEAPVLYGCLLLANAGSLFLPGSNLTNLIVLGPFHLTGATFLGRSVAPALAALVATALVVAVFERRALRAPAQLGAPRHVRASGSASSPCRRRRCSWSCCATPRCRSRRSAWRSSPCAWRAGRARLGDLTDVLGAPVLVGLFGAAVALGALGRAWSGPATLLTHLDVVGTAALAALAAVLVNNLPAASLLAARAPAHPFALLIGLNLGPNLFVSGSLAWLLWLRVARAAGARPSIATASRLGLVAVPLSMAAALGALVLSGKG